MNVLEQAKVNNKLLVLFFADTEKAFDQVDWVFMKQVMEKTGFGRHDGYS